MVYKAKIRETYMTYQLFPPDDHQRNLAEKALQTWKDHFISVLIGTADTFPLHLWCQAIPQMELQLLLLCQSRVNPRVSAYAHVYGQHDYNAEPFVPIGMETLVHEKPHRRRTFAEHCKKGFVLGTSFEHYRAWTIWMKDTQAQRVSSTVFHKHKYISAPATTPEDAVIASAQNLAMILKGKYGNTLGDTTLEQLTRLSSVFTQATASAPEQPQQSPDHGLPAKPQQQHPRRATKVLANGRIVTVMTPPLRPIRKPIPAPDRAPVTPPPQTAAPTPKVAHQPAAATAPPPRVETVEEEAPAPRVETVEEETPAPRVAPRWSARIAANTALPKHEPLGPAYNTRSRQAMLACA
jgi:hypothetical protein